MQPANRLLRRIQGAQAAVQDDGRGRFLTGFRLDAAEEYPQILHVHLPPQRPRRPAEPNWDDHLIAEVPAQPLTFDVRPCQ